MSRCFPYPPPGYCEKKSSKEALIESIKLQSEREKSKAERKEEKKRDKKGKRSNKKEKAKRNLNVGYDEKAHEGLKTWIGFKGGYNEKTREDSAELLERSVLTEEHEQPVCLHKPCYSSDSTQNSNKRKMHASPTSSSISGHGNIIRIRLPLQKHKAPDSGKESLCSTSGRTDLSAPLATGTGTVVQGLHQRHTELICSTSGTSEIFAQVDNRIAPDPKPFENEMHKLNLVYEDLIGSWVPPALQSELSDFDDQEWLFGQKQKRQDTRQGEKRQKADGNISCCDNLTLWPQAQYLPEVDIYALPYAIPF